MSYEPSATNFSSLLTLGPLVHFNFSPGELGLLPYGKPDIDDAMGFYASAKEIYEKVKRFLERG